MNVLHVLDSLNRGGAEVLELDLCRNAAANGLNLTFVATGGGDLEEDFRHSGIEFIRLQRRLAIDLGVVAQLRKIIRKRDIRIVHCHQPVEALHLYLATCGTEVKRVLTLHGLYLGTKNELALKLMLPRMHARILVSKELRGIITKQQDIDPGNQCLVVYNGVDSARLRFAKPSLRKELGLLDGALLIGMVANFYPDGRKDQLTVCKALPAILRRAPTTHCVFAGEGIKAEPYLFDQCVSHCREQGISDRVHFLGKRSDIADLLSSLDVFLLSSFVEGMPVAALEAMAMGIPAVFSDIGALREVSADGQYALLFRAGDPDDLTAKLANLLEQPERRFSLGAEGQKWALSQFSIQMHIQNLVRLYANLAG